MRTGGQSVKKMSTSYYQFIFTLFTTCPLFTINSFLHCLSALYLQFFNSLSVGCRGWSHEDCGSQVEGPWFRECACEQVNEACTVKHLVDKTTQSVRSAIQNVFVNLYLIIFLFFTSYNF